MKQKASGKQGKVSQYRIVKIENIKGLFDLDSKDYIGKGYHHTAKLVRAVQETSKDVEVRKPRISGTDFMYLVPESPATSVQSDIVAVLLD